MRNRKFQLVAFDFDGTLVDTSGDIAAAVNAARISFGLAEMAPPEIIRFVGHGIGSLAEEVFRNTGVSPQEAMDRMLEYYIRRPFDHARLYSGVRELLPEIPAVRTIVSNKPRSLVVAALSHFQIADLFEHVIGGDTFPRRKPDPMALQYLMDRYEATAPDTLVVGDHEPDVEMARAVGAACAYCRYGFFGSTSVECEYTLDHFGDLKALFS
jgi:phosphoglycolate phosphatase